MDQLRTILLLTLKCVRVIARKRSNRTLALLSSMMIFGTLFGMRYLTADTKMHFLTSDAYDKLDFQMTCTPAVDDTHKAKDPIDLPLDLPLQSSDKDKVGVSKGVGKGVGKEGKDRDKSKSVDREKEKGGKGVDKGKGDSSVGVGVGVGVQQRTLQCRPDDSVSDGASRGLSPTDVLFSALASGSGLDPTESMRFTALLSSVLMNGLPLLGT
jgi:hypothetical protein